MKKWKLSELFSQMDIPAGRLPEISSREEISYKSVQKKVMEKLDSRETITTEPQNKDMRKRFFIGVGIVALLTAGGIGAVSGTHAARNMPVEETAIRSTIDSDLFNPENIIVGTTAVQTTKGASQAYTAVREQTTAVPQTMTNSGSTQTAIIREVPNTGTQRQDIRAVIDPPKEMESAVYEQPAPDGCFLACVGNFAGISQEELDISNGYFTDVYDYRVEDNMEEVDIEDVKVYSRDGYTYCMLHITNQFTDGTLFSELDLNQLVMWSQTSMKYKTGGGLDIGILSCSDDYNLYLIFNMYGPIDNEMNECSFSIYGLMRNGYDRITELGMKSQLGMTHADIAQHKEYTAEQQALLDSEYQYHNGSYYRKSDILSYGSLRVWIDPSEKKPDILSIAIPSMDSYFGVDASQYMQLEWEANSTVTNELTLVEVGTPKVYTFGSLTEVQIELTAVGDYRFSPETNLNFLKATPYIIVPETGLRRTMEDVTLRYDEAVTSDGRKCILHFELMHRDLEELRFRVQGGNLISILADGRIQTQEEGTFLADMLLFDTKPMYANGLEYSFTTDDGYLVDVVYNGEQITMQWQTDGTHALPECLLHSDALTKGAADAYNAAVWDEGISIVEGCTITTYEGFEHPLCLNVRGYADGVVMASAYTYSGYIYMGEENGLKQIRFNDGAAFNFD